VAKYLLGIEERIIKRQCQIKVDDQRKGVVIKTSIRRILILLNKYSKKNITLISNKGKYDKYGLIAVVYTLNISKIFITADPHSISFYHFLQSH